jgi:hypothetical protein
MIDQPRRPVLAKRDRSASVRNRSLHAGRCAGAVKVKNAALDADERLTPSASWPVEASPHLVVPARAPSGAAPARGRTCPARWRHWRLGRHGDIARRADRQTGWLGLERGWLRLDRNPAITLALGLAVAVQGGHPRLPRPESRTHVDDDDRAIARSPAVCSTEVDAVNPPAAIFPTCRRGSLATDSPVALVCGLSVPRLTDRCGPRLSLTVPWNELGDSRRRRKREGGERRKRHCSTHETPLIARGRAGAMCVTRCERISASDPPSIALTVHTVTLCGLHRVRALVRRPGLRD